MLFHSKKGFLMVLGYIRVSTESQSVLNQKHKILEFAQQKKIIVDKFIEIEISSKKSQKARLLDDLFIKMQKGDILICTELSRLGRNMLEILNLIEKFNTHGIKLIFTNQPELSTNQNESLSKLLLAIYGYFAQTEREIISERTKQGLSAAKAQGKTRSDFMIDAARKAAEETLLDQALVRVDQASYEYFLEALDKPASGEGFERLMSAPKPWDV